jgi:hypothetical protein
VIKGGEDKKSPNGGIRQGFLNSEPASYPVEFAKFTQGLSGFAAFFDTGFFVVFTPFQLSFNTVDLQFFLQLPDRVFKVTSDIDFDHDCITSFGGWPRPFNKSIVKNKIKYLFYLGLSMQITGEQGGLSIFRWGKQGGGPDPWPTTFP